MVASIFACEAVP